jgi:hypothetical protein
MQRHQYCDCATNYHINQLRNISSLITILFIILLPTAATAQGSDRTSDIMDNYQEMTSIGNPDCQPPATGDEIIVCAKTKKRDYRIAASEGSNDESRDRSNTRSAAAAISPSCADRSSSSQGAGCGKGLDIMKILGTIAR